MPSEAPFLTWYQDGLVAVAPAVVAVAPARVMVGQRKLHALLEPLDAILDLASLTRVEAAARPVVQPVLDIAGLVDAAGRRCGRRRASRRFRRSICRWTLSMRC